jgi:hypothetical protein
MAQSEHVPEDYDATLFSGNPQRPCRSQDRQNEDEERVDQGLFQNDSLHVGGSSASNAFLQEIFSLPQQDADWSTPPGVISGLNSPGASESLNSVNGSFKNGEDVKQEIQLIDLGPEIPEVLLLETDTKEKCDDEMERAATGGSLSDKLSCDSSGGDEVGEKKPTPSPGRPRVLRLGDRCVTPQKTRQSSLSPPTDPPGSPTSMRTNTSRSEIYHYTYETTSRSPPSPVPPFVVVHNSGVAHVTIRPTGRVVRGPSTVNEEEEEEIVLPYRSLWRPAFLFVLAALLFLAVITMVSGLVREQELQRSGGSSSNNPPPSGYPKTQSPTVSPLSAPTPKPVFEVPNEDDDAIILIPPLEDGKSPREETESPAYVAPTRPPRTRAPVTTSPTFAQTPGPTELKFPIDDTPSPSETRPTQPPRTHPPVPQPKPTAQPTWQPTYPPSIEPAEEQPSDPPFIEAINDDDATQVARAEDYVLGLIARSWPPAYLAISEQNSPQYKAFEWVVSDPMVVNFSYTDTRIIQRWILAIWYYSTLGDNWIRSDNWLTYTNECDWFSTRNGGDHICDGDGNLQIIELERNRLTGSIPQELGLLSNSLSKLAKPPSVCVCQCHIILPLCLFYHERTTVSS